MNSAHEVSRVEDVRIEAPLGQPGAADLRPFPLDLPDAVSELEEIARSSPDLDAFECAALRFSLELSFRLSMPVRIRCTYVSAAETADYVGGTWGVLPEEVC